MTVSIELGTTMPANPVATLPAKAADGSGFAQTLSSSLQAGPAAPQDAAASQAASSAVATAANASPAGKHIAVLSKDAIRGPAQKRKTQDERTAGSDEAGVAAWQTSSALPVSGVVSIPPILSAGSATAEPSGPAQGSVPSSAVGALSGAELSSVVLSGSATAHGVNPVHALAVETGGNTAASEALSTKNSPETSAALPPRSSIATGEAANVQNRLAGATPTGAIAAHGAPAPPTPLAGGAGSHPQAPASQGVGAQHAAAGSTNGSASDTGNAAVPGGSGVAQSHRSAGAGSGDSNLGQAAPSAPPSGSASAGNHEGSQAPAASPAQATAATLPPVLGAAAPGAAEIAMQLTPGTLSGEAAASPMAGAAPSGAAAAPERDALQPGDAPIAGMPAINSARVLASLGGTEMRVGMHSAEFGSISIATSVSPAGLSAQIALGHAEAGDLGGALGRALAAHVPAIEEKLGSALGVTARVEIRDASSGAHTAGSGSQTGGGGRHADGGSPARAVTPLAGYGAAAGERSEREEQDARLSVRA